MSSRLRHPRRGGIWADNISAQVFHEQRMGEGLQNSENTEGLHPTTNNSPPTTHNKLNRDIDFVALDLDGVCGDLDRPVGAGLARTHIVFLQVPRAGHDAAFEHAFAERAALMAAGVVRGIEIPAHAEQGHSFAVHISHHAGPGGEVGDLRDSDVISHTWNPVLKFEEEISSDRATPPARVRASRPCRCGYFS